MPRQIRIETLINQQFTIPDGITDWGAQSVIRNKITQALEESYASSDDWVGGGGLVRVISRVTEKMDWVKVNP